jgi:hypothetical protein
MIEHFKMLVKLWFNIELQVIHHDLKAKLSNASEIMFFELNNTVYATTYKINQKCLTKGLTYMVYNLSLGCKQEPVFLENFELAKTHILNKINYSRFVRKAPCAANFCISPPIIAGVAQCPVCCGQDHPSTNPQTSPHFCPPEKPTCIGFKQGHHMGHCSDEPPTPPTPPPTKCVSEDLAQRACSVILHEENCPKYFSRGHRMNEPRNCIWIKDQQTLNEGRCESSSAPCTAPPLPTCPISIVTHCTTVEAWQCVGKSQIWGKYRHACVTTDKSASMRCIMNASACRPP